MRLEDLNIFVVTANYKSMVKASEILHVSQQSITNSIKSLENELQKTLFVRSKKGSILTKEGLEVYSVVNDILLKINSLYPQKNNALAHSGSLFLNLIYSPAFKPIAGTLLDSLYAKHGNASSHICITELDALEINESYLPNPNDTDILFTTINEDFLNHYKAFLESYDVYLLNRSRLKIFVTDNHPYASKKQLSLYSLKKYPCINFSSNAKTHDSFYSDLLKSYGCEIFTAIHSNDSSIINKYMHENMCFYISTEFSMRINPDSSNHLHKVVTITTKQKINILFLILIPKSSSPNIAVFNKIFADNYPNVEQIKIE